MEKRAIKKTKTEKKKEKSNKSIRKLIRNNKKLVIVISIIVMVFLSFVAYRLWLNIHFLITDDLILYLEPNDKSLAIHYEEKPNITFSVDIENSFFCDTYCSYEFKDISTKTLLDKGIFTSKGIEKKFKKDFQLSVDRVGSGQKIYSFEVQCNNMRTWHCLTNKNKRKRSAFVTLNYDISDYEEFLKITLKENITKLVNELSAIDITIQELNNRFFEFGFQINLNEFEDNKEILNNNYDAIVLEFKNLERVWSEQDYLLLSELFNNSYDIRILNIQQNISDINSKIENIIEKHNSLVDEINRIDDNLRDINETISFLGRAESKLIVKHNDLIKRIGEIKSHIEANTFSDYIFLENEIKKIKESSENFEKDLKKNFMEVYLKGSYYLSQEKEKLCDIKETCLDKTNFLMVVTNSLYVDDSKINDLCLSLESIKGIYEIENNESKELIKNYNIDEIQPILGDVKSKKLAIIKKNTYNEIKNITQGNETDGPLKVLINLSNTNSNFSEEIDYQGFTKNEILSLIQLNLSIDSGEYYKDYCKIKDAYNISEYSGNKTQLNKISDVKASNFRSRIDIKLTENYPICCVFGVCKRCCTQEECRQDPALYPILFLHGHTLRKDNNPDFSLDAFNKIQAKLQEEGYISAGTITPVSDYSEIKQNEWGRSSKPISVKGSYYLVSYYNIGSYAIATQKSENIETYAIRLKELIDLLKFRTGRDKINIIAHSMGSLVARDYIQIFGGSSVDKLIMITSPNKGISGQISSYCPILGEKKECEDMSKNSIFIKKLNDPLKIPKNNKIYNIIGIGCNMNSKTGDGIVLKENAELHHAENYYINGTCSRLKLLHTEILNIGKYPEVYEIISSILKS